MRTEDQVKRKQHELTQLLQNCQDEQRISTVKAQIEMLDWVMNNPTGAYHFEDME
jgi:hypothetical protein